MFCSSRTVTCETLPRQATIFINSSVLVVLLVGLLLRGSPVMAQTQDNGFPLEAGQAAYISIRSLEDGSETPLTQGRRPAWSPDGTRIAFYRPASTPRQGDMFLINVDGSGLTWLGSGVEPDWSPDGELIVFVNDEGIAIRAIGDTQSVAVLGHRFLAGVPQSAGGADYGEYDWGVGRPMWSPDGAHIIFEHLGAPDWKESLVWIMRADGTESMLLTPYSPYGHPESDPAWSPDGAWIALYSARYGLELFEIENGHRISLLQNHGTPGVYPGAKPTWSPTSSSLAFSGISPFSGGPEVWLIQKNGDLAHAFISNAYEPDWAPSQAQIAFVSNIEKVAAAHNFPPVMGEAMFYDRQGTHAHPAEARSRILLNQDGTFELQYLLTTGESLSYGGVHVQIGSILELNFDGDDRWQATGVFDRNETTLQLSFNTVMSLGDFEDGIYSDVSNDPEGPVKEPDEPKDPPWPELP